MKSLKTEAIVLRVVNYGESDFMLTLLTPMQGLLGAKAAGARKSQKRFGGALQTGSVINAELSAGKIGGFRLNEALYIHGGNPSDDLSSFAQISYLCELALNFCQEGERSQEIFEYLKKLFERYAKKEHTLYEFMIFEARFLELAGFRPRLDECAVCRVKPCGKERFYADRTMESGELFCREHAPQKAQEIDSSTALMLAFIVSREMPEAEFGKKINKTLLRKIFSSYIKGITGRTMKSEPLLNL